MEGLTPENLINVGELIEQLQSKAIIVIRLDGFDLKGATNYLKGDFEDFIAAAKALNENVVFLSEVVLFQNEFFTSRTTRFWVNTNSLLLRLTATKRKRS